MNDVKSQLNILLLKIAEEISISQSMLDEAISSYEAVGKWLGDGIEYDVRISPQGSMNLGTTIKPISDKDDYDIDLVCMLENGQRLDSFDIKNIVGQRLKENAVYRKKILAEGEGTRCWKMQYNAFHMDILPCVPKYYYNEPRLTDIRLTHKISSSIYEDRFSNPYGYRKWFEQRMINIVKKEKELYASRNKIEIEDVPIFRIKTPLQVAIQLMKRHRDIYFQYDDENAPISIIITTLAAKAYKGEENIYDALVGILNSMSNYIENRNGIYWVQNPVMNEENFADKWQKYPNRKNAFYTWLESAKDDFLKKPLNVEGLDKLSELFIYSLGEGPVKRAFRSYGESIRKAREDNKLYSSDLIKGLSLIKSNSATKVKGHTFFGE